MRTEQTGTDAGLTILNPNVNEQQAPSFWFAFHTLRSKMWWKNAFLSAITFAPHCFVPAAFGTMFAVILVVGNNLSFSPLNNQPFDITAVFKAMAILLVTGIVAIALLFISFGGWLIALTAYTKSFASLSRAQLVTSELDARELRELQLKTIAEVKERRAHLGKYWCYASLLMLIPLLATGLAIVLKVCEPQFSAALSFKMPPGADVALTVFAACSSLYLTAFSLIGIVVSSVSNKEPVEAVQSTVLLSFKAFVPAGLLAAVLLLVNVLVTAPQEIPVLLHPDPAQLMSRSLALTLVEEIWQGVSSIILLPLSIAPFCELLRGSFE